VACTSVEVFNLDSQLSQIERVLFFESFLPHMVSCDWPVRNTQHCWPEFHGSW